jgi:hypothetical protein
MGLKQEGQTPEKMVELPKFPNYGFLRGQIGPSKYPPSNGTNSKILTCQSCGHDRKPKDPRRFFNIGNIQIVDECCGQFLDHIIDAGFDPKDVVRALNHPEWKTSQAIYSRIQKEVVDPINNS